MAEADRDQKVTQAYRALGGEEPPRALDEAILAASRRRPAHWRVPLSIAAVLVLAVGVTLRMLAPQPEAESVALAPQVMQTPRPAVVPEAPRDKLEQGESRPAGPPADARMARGDERRATIASAGARARQAETPPRVAQEPAALAPEGAASAPATPPLAHEAPREPAAAAASQVQPPALAKLSEAALTPEKWLERIAELRKQGREREAQESLAEFKKRYPDYKIPEALTR